MVIVRGLKGPRRRYHRIERLLSELANPNLRDIPTHLPFRVEMRDRHDQHIRWVIAASSSVEIGHAALDAAVCELSQPTLHAAQRDTGHSRTRAGAWKAALDALSVAPQPASKTQRLFRG